MKQQIIIFGCLLASGITLLKAEERDSLKKDSHLSNSLRLSDPGCFLRVRKLCANMVRTRQFCAGDARIRNLCAVTANSNLVNAELLHTNTGCFNTVNAKIASVEYLTTNTLCTQALATSLLCTTSIQAQNICVNGNVEQCTCFKGIAGVDPEYTYTLGNPIIFNTIIDDPCHNFVQTATEGTVFIAPRSGYYIVELETTFRDLQGPTVISGVPVVENTIVVNGLPRREGRYSFLAFSNDQVNDTTALVRLAKGDKIGGLMNILVQDPFAGQVRYPGTVTMDGAPITNDSLGGTLLSVHYLSSDCPIVCNPCVPLPVCQPVTVNCPQVAVQCGPCPIACGDCDADDDDDDIREGDML